MRNILSWANEKQEIGQLRYNYSTRIAFRPVRDA
jgi:hypothetical protein